MSQTQCPKCSSEAIYQDGNLWICPECEFEWMPDSLKTAAAEAPAEESGVIKDAYGTPLTDGDAVSVIKDLKIRGSSSVVKVGTKIKSIRLVDSTDGHNIACRIDGVGAINIKSEFVKKA